LSFENLAISIIEKMFDSFKKLAKDWGLFHYMLAGTLDMLFWFNYVELISMVQSLGGVLICPFHSRISLRLRLRLRHYATITYTQLATTMGDTIAASR